MTREEKLAHLRATLSILDQSFAKYQMSFQDVYIELQADGLVIENDNLPEQLMPLQRLIWSTQRARNTIAYEICVVMHQETNDG